MMGVRGGFAIGSPPTEEKPFMLRLLPWKFFVKHAARRYGVLDPAMLLARIRRFAQPSEIAEPMELLRAGIVFHARGLVNAKAIQHNLDWVWPYWVERQFNPADPSFVPRAFSFSHINLTHRNWTAIGLPDVPVYPIIDPRGLVTPLHDGWSLDFWIVTDQGKRLLPSKLDDASVKQSLRLDPTLTVDTQCQQDGLRLDLTTDMIALDLGCAEVRTRVCAISDEDGWIVVAVRPYNPEGIQFIDHIEIQSSGDSFRVNDEATVRLGVRPDALRMAHYAEGDVYLDLPERTDRREVHCDVGMATAAALFRIRAGVSRELNIAVTLERDLKDLIKPADTSRSWASALSGTTELRLPDAKMQFLYDAAVRSLIHLSAGDLVPGPYTYRRFWFRDACLMLHPLMLIGKLERAERILDGFPARQNRSGYFLSQEGEWDSNGQVLWIAARYAALSGKRLERETERSLRKAVRWLARKRVSSTASSGVAGLLPAGFSAEHLGPNDFYYWDDFWALGGLKAIAEYWRRAGDIESEKAAESLAGEFAQSIQTSIVSIPLSRAKGAIPAAPGRRLDAGAIGSMVADYPLQLDPPGEERLMKTADFLMECCFQQGGFFQEMIHSGINAYLTLDLAQTLLRAGDPRFGQLVRSVADLASPTGQWPEAIHPQTLGGCMGDGQHGWAAAEWIMMMRNCFVREEKDILVIGSGILSEWLVEGGEIYFGPTSTAWGTVSVKLAGALLTLSAQWRDVVPCVKIAVPGFLPIEADPSVHLFQLQKV
jgi:hypothetical protein